MLVKSAKNRNKRLRFEQLESRSMLSVNGLGTLVGEGFPADMPMAVLNNADVSTAVAGAMANTPVASSSAVANISNSPLVTMGEFGSPIGGFAGLPGSNLDLESRAGAVAFAALNPSTASIAVEAAGSASGAPDMGGGVGQMIITNGTGTPGISSFASPTNGFGDISRGGGMVKPGQAYPKQESGEGNGAKPAGGTEDGGGVDLSMLDAIPVAV